MATEKKQFRGVVSFHKYRATCGVARFNASLASQLEVPFVDLETWLSLGERSDFVLSVKPTELDEPTKVKLLKTLDQRPLDLGAVVFHEFFDSDIDRSLAIYGRQCVAVDHVISDKARRHCPHVQVGFAPGLAPFTDFIQPEVQLFSMGMAHKINLAGYERLSKLIGSDSRSFVLRVAAAVHQGFDVGEAFESVPRDIGSCWRDRFLFLGFLSDELMSVELSHSDVAVLFGQYGARQSSSSILTAMHHGVPVISVLDGSSSPWMKHGETIFDISKMERFPSQEELTEVAFNARSFVENLSFANLAEFFY